MSYRRELLYLGPRSGTASASFHGLTCNLSKMPAQIVVLQNEAKIHKALKGLNKTPGPWGGTIREKE